MYDSFDIEFKVGITQIYTFKKLKRLEKLTKSVKSSRQIQLIDIVIDKQQNDKNQTVKMMKFQKKTLKPRAQVKHLFIAHFLVLNYFENIL